MPILELSLDEPTYAALRQKARQLNRPVKETAQTALVTFLNVSNRQTRGDAPNAASSPSVSRRAKIHAEAEAWRALPPTERNKYGDEFVAVHNGRVIDHDPDRLTLYRRMRAQLGNTPALITPAGAPSPREFLLLSPRLDERV